MFRPSVVSATRTLRSPDPNRLRATVSRRGCRRAPGGPATARATLTRWLTGRVPGGVLADVRLLASELVANGGGLESPYEAAALRFTAELRDGILRVDLRAPSRAAAPRPALRRGGFALQIVEALAGRWGAEDDETHLWFEVDATGWRRK
jgi:hypothetical protein